MQRERERERKDCLIEETRGKSGQERVSVCERENENPIAPVNEASESLLKVVDQLKHFHFTSCKMIKMETSNGLR